MEAVNTLVQSLAQVPRRILVVEDNEDYAATITLVLETAGQIVQRVPSGELALAIAPQFQPQIVLLDLGLPGMDGYEVARQLRHTPGGEHLILVAVTAYGQPADRQRTRSAGFSYHLLKPVALEDLARVIVASTSGCLLEIPGDGN